MKGFARGLIRRFKKEQFLSAATRASFARSSIRRFKKNILSIKARFYILDISRAFYYAVIRRREKGCFAGRSGGKLKPGGADATCFCM